MSLHPVRRYLALGTLAVVLVLPLSGCAGLTPGFLACLLSGGATTEECLADAVSPGPPSAPVDLTAVRIEDGPHVQIRWRHNQEPDVHRYRVYAANRQGGPYGELFADSNDDIIASTFDETCRIAQACPLSTCTRYYVITAVDLSNQESPRSAEASVRIDCTPPPAPAGLEARAGNHRVHLSWEHGGIELFAVYRSEDEDGPFVRLAFESSEFYDDDEVENGVKYFYRVTAFDEAGNESEPSAVVDATPKAPEVDDPPAAPANLTARGGNHIVTLDWDDNTEPDLAGFRVFQLAEDGNSVVELTTGFLTVSEFVAENLPNGVEVRLRVLAYDLGGNLTPASTVAATPHAGEPPFVPTGLTATPGDGRVQLDWADNPAPDLAGYNVYLADEADGAYSQLNGQLLSASDFLHLGLANGVPRYYRVSAVDVDRNESDPSAFVSATPQAVEQPPAAPTGLTATPGDHLVALDWADNAEADLAGYDVELATAEAGPFGSALRRLVTVSQHTVFDLPTTQPFFFRVVAVDTTGARSAPSAVVSATPCPAACLGPALRLLLSRAVVSAGPASVPFELTVSGAFGGGGSSRRDGESIVGSGLGFTGTFELEPALKGLDPELKELAGAGLGGSWSARVDWRLSPGAGTATTTGIALATFANPRVGVACLRFENTSTVKKRGTTRRVVTNGAFTFLGGTEAAAKLLGGGSYRLEPLPDGRLRYDGRATPATGAAPLSAECRALEAP